MIVITKEGLQLGRIVEKDDAIRKGDTVRVAEILYEELLEDVMDGGGTIALGPKPGKFSDTIRSVTKISE